LLQHFIWPGIKNKLETDLKMWMNHTLEGFDYMGPKATVFMAEIRAITTVAHTLMQRKKQKIVIRCDSQAAIININSKTVLECRKLLNQLGARNNLKICWIKAHASHAGNEMADRLAKMGANQTIGPACFKYYEAIASTNQSLIARCNQKWQARCPTGNLLTMRYLVL
jgi:ribonuclease HI